MINKIKKELSDYKDNQYEIYDGFNFSASKLIRRISLFKNQIYPKGKQDSQGNYKYWFDIITPRRNAEVKNIDFKTNAIKLYSDQVSDEMRILLANASMKEWLQETGQAQKLQESVETGTDWGNVVWKKVKNEYIIVDFNHFRVLNQVAKTLQDSDVIEDLVMSAHDIVDKEGVWENVEEFMKSIVPSKKKDPTNQYYIYERNGYLTEKEFNKAYHELYGNGKADGSDSKFVYAKVIVGAIQKDIPTHVLFIEKLDESPYKEYHRTPYSGRWLRMGMYETLFDIQTRANQIGNQIAQGLEWAAKTVFRSSDRVIAQNILTDLQSGDIIKSQDLQQVTTRMEGLDQLIADWNRLMKLADELANSYEVITGAGVAGAKAQKTAALMNMNAAKFFDFMRDKLGIAFQDLIEDWILPDLLKALNRKKVLRLTADSGALTKYYEAVIEDWYVQNLLTFPPHNSDQAKIIKGEKLKEIMANPEAVVQLEKDMWKEFKPRVKVIITGENFNVITEIQDLIQFAGLEQDPIKRSALIDMAMEKRGFDISRLPKPSPQQNQPPQAPQTAQAPDSQNPAVINQ